MIRAAWPTAFDRPRVHLRVCPNRDGVRRLPLTVRWLTVASASCGLRGRAQRAVRGALDSWGRGCGSHQSPPRQNARSARGSRASLIRVASAVPQLSVGLEVETAVSEPGWLNHAPLLGGVALATSPASTSAACVQPSRGFGHCSVAVSAGCFTPFPAFRPLSGTPPTQTTRAPELDCLRR